MYRKMLTAQLENLFIIKYIIIIILYYTIFIGRCNLDSIAFQKYTLHLKWQPIKLRFIVVYTFIQSKVQLRQEATEQLTVQEPLLCSLAALGLEPIPQPIQSVAQTYNYDK